MTLKDKGTRFIYGLLLIIYILKVERHKTVMLCCLRVLYRDYHIYEFPSRKLNVNKEVFTTGTFRNNLETEFPSWTGHKL